MNKKMKWGGMLFASLLMASSCQNEEIVSDIQSGNYTLNVSSFVGSRTHVEQDGTVKWSKGDKLYVYGQGVSGVLTLDDNDADKTDGKFSGFVFGNPQNLKWAVFGDNVKFTNDGAQFTIKEVTDPNSNSPMVGEIGNGNVQMEHLCGMVRLTINNLPQNATVTLGGTGIAGTAEVKDGKITTIASEHSISLKTVEGTDNVFEIPVFASEEEETPVEFTLTIDGVSTSFNAPIKVKSLSQDAIKTFNCAVDATTGKVTGFAFAVGTEAALHNALSEGGNIALSNDITLTNKWAGTVEKFIGTLNGNGYTIKGIADANADEIYSIKDLIADTSEAKLKNVNFEFADESSHSYSEDASYELKSNSDGEIILYSINRDFKGETFNIPEGVTALRNGVFAFNSLVKEVVIPTSVENFGGTPNSTQTGASGGAFKDSSVEKITLQDGLTIIPDAAFNGATKLKEVNIPSSVTEIGINAFRNTAIERMTIPSTVKVIKYGAFRTMTNLTTVTIEGEDVELPTYAFRECTNLTTVYLKINTLTLASGQIFTNTQSDNPGTNKITIYVYNDDVYNTLINNSTLTCNVVKVASVSEGSDLSTSLNNGGAAELVAGEYTLPAVENSTVNISGPKDAIITIGTPGFGGSDVTLNGVTVKGSGIYTGIQSVNTVEYNDVKVEGEMCLYGKKVVFNNCEFELAKGQYIWTYAAEEVEFNNCTFNTAGKAILIYNEGYCDTKVSVEYCTFNASASDKAGAIANQNCAAVEIHNYAGKAHSLVTIGNTYSDKFSGEWRIKDYVTGSPIVVNGVEYTSIAIDGKTMEIDADKNVTVNE